MATRFKMNKGWKRLEHALDPKQLTSTVRKHLRRAARLNGKLAEAAVRKEMSTGKFKPNAPLTVAIKGGRNEPLQGYRTGSPMFKAITSQIIDDHTVFIGVLQANEQYNIALVVHEGATIEVTDAMRGLFSILAAAERDPKIEKKLTGRARELWDQMPGGWYPLKPSTKAIIIPKRPFIEQAFKQAKLQKQVKLNWEQAIEAAMKEQAG